MHLYLKRKRGKRGCNSHGEQHVAIATERAETGLMFRVSPFRAAAATVSCSIWNDSKVQSLVGVGPYRIQLAIASGTLVLVLTRVKSGCERVETETG